MDGTGDETDDVWQRAEIESPCVKVCVLHPSAKLCMGCYRSGAEIARWARMSPQERRAILDELPSRAPLLAQSRRGGRRAAAARRNPPGA